MITITEVLVIHQNLIQQHGGANGIRDFGGLESAIARPYQTFDGKELYHSIFEKQQLLLKAFL